MNKKFLSAILFGALLASTTGTFTSCKDYDDDINGLSERVDAIEKTLAELNTKFGSLAYVKSVSFADGKLVVTDQNGDATTYNIPDTDTNTTYTLNVTQDGNKATITLTDDKGNVQTKEIEFTDTDTDTKFDPSALVVGKDGVTIEYNGEATGVKLPTLVSNALSVTEFTKDGVTYGWAVKCGDSEPVNLMITDILPLTGFSFEPDAILGGVPSMKALSVEYKAWSEKTSCEPATATGEVWTQSTDKSYISPVIVGKYYLNPSSATKDQIVSIEVLSRDIEYISKTRAADCAPSVDSYSVKDGMLTVNFKANAELIKAVETSEITGFKIRVKTKAGNTITDQDYRGVYATKYTTLVLADKKKKAANPTNHDLYGANSGTARVAIDKIPDYELSYKSTTGLDMKPLVVTCYKDEATKATHQTMSDKDLESLGLHYEFHLCNYIQGDNGTAQNDYAKIVDGVLYPKLYNETGTPYAAVGRMPLVRVQLMTKDNQVVSTGWIKVEIVKDKIPAEEVEFDYPAFTNQCANKEFKLTVEQMNVKVYNKLGLDRTQFNKEYTIKQVSTVEGEANYGKGDGTVALVSDADPTTMTDLLTWTVTQADMAAALAKDGTLTTVVTYAANDPKSRGDVTITFTSKVNAIDAVTIPDNNKIKEYWDANKEYVRLNVAVPDGSNTCTFVVDLDNVFMGNKPAIGSDKYKYVFAAKNITRTDAVGLSGTKYVLTLSDNAETLYANGEKVATIEETTGVISYANTDEAKDLLNVASHSSVPNAFYAWINIKAVTGECELELPITNGEFRAFFLRPINVAAGAGKFQDAVDNGSTVNMLDLLKFTDWRDYEFSPKTNKIYFKFYEVTAISVDLDEITTDLNGGDINTQKLSSVTSELKVTQDAKTFKVNEIPTSPAADAYGTVTYKNNGTAVGAFNLRLPVTVTYKWGTVKAYVTIPVEKTQGN